MRVLKTFEYDDCAEFEVKSIEGNNTVCEYYVKQLSRQVFVPKSQLNDKALFKKIT